MAAPRCCMLPSSPIVEVLRPEGRTSLAWSCCFLQGCAIEECGSGHCAHPCCLARLYQIWDSAFTASMRTVPAMAEAQAARESRYFRTCSVPGAAIELEVCSDGDCDAWAWGPPSLFQIREQEYRRLRRLGLVYL